MGLYDDMLAIYKYLRNDEELLRLLYYSPENIGANILDPLSPSLPNILEKDSVELAKIQNEHIMKSEKADDLVKKQICRLYMYAGRNSDYPRNDLLTKQELVIDLFVHSRYEEGDFRLSRIKDRLNEILVNSHVAGIGKMDYSQGNPRSAPSEYRGYEHVYTFLTNKS